MHRERVGTAQRNHVLDLLGRALAEGYLDLSEYEQRAGRVAAAKTAGELISQVEDLPANFRWVPQPAPYAPAPLGATAGATGAPHVGRNTHVSSIASLVLGIASLPFALCVGIGALFGVAAVVLAIPGLRNHTDYGKSIVGMVLGALGIVLGLGMLALMFVVEPSTEATT